MVFFFLVKQCFSKWDKLKKFYCKLNCEVINGTQKYQKEVNEPSWELYKLFNFLDATEDGNYINV